MRVAGSIRARGLILDGSNDTEYAGPPAVAVDAKAVGTVEPRQRLRLRMARIAGLTFFVDDMIEFRCVRGVGDPAFLIEDANLYHAGLAGHGLDRVVEAFAVVAQHVLGGAARDDVADSLSAEQSHLL